MTDLDQKAISSSSKTASSRMSRSSPDAAADRPVAPARQQRQHGDKLPTLQDGGNGFVRRLRPNDLAQVIDFDSRVEIRQGFTEQPRELERRSSRRRPAARRRCTTPSTSR